MPFQMSMQTQVCRHEMLSYLPYCSLYWFGAHFSLFLHIQNSQIESYKVKVNMIIPEALHSLLLST